MKKLLIILLFATIAGQSQTYWADSLAKFQKQESKKTYGWFDSLSSTKQQQRITNWYSLQIKVAIEARQRNINDSITGVNQQNTIKQAYIQHLQSIGYQINEGVNRNQPTQADWRKAYNHPEWFGSRWSMFADSCYLHLKLSDFLDLCRIYRY